MRIADEPAHERLQACQRLLFAGAFPDDENAAAAGGKRRVVLLVPLLVSGKLRPPVIRIGLRKNGSRAAPVLMPEAAVDENHGPPFGKNNVGLARKTADMQAKAKAVGKEKPPHGHLGLRVFGDDGPHDLRALFRSEDVGHLRTAQMQAAAFSLKAPFFCAARYSL